MLRFRLTYHDRYRRLRVLIVDSWSLVNARFRALVEGLDQGTKFCEGQELDRHSAALVPDDAIGHLLSLEEASKIIRKIERGIPKQAAAASVRRRGSVRTRARR